MNAEKMSQAVASLSDKILTHQGNGDYAGVKQWFDDKGHINEQLKRSLQRINEAGIPVDVVFQQGVKYWQ